MVACAVERYHRAVQLDPNNVRILSSYGTYLRKHLADKATGLKQANMLYMRAIKIDPKHVRTLCNLGKIRTIAKDTKGALAFYRRALEIEPNNVIILTTVASLPSVPRDEACRLFARALELDPHDPWIAQNKKYYRQ